MADEKKRIISLTETENIGVDDYIAMDSTSGGTKKVLASKFTGGSDNVMWGGIGGSLDSQTDLKNALDDIKNNTILIDNEGKFFVIT